MTKPFNIIMFLGTLVFVALFLGFTLMDATITKIWLSQDRLPEVTQHYSIKFLI